MDWTSPVDLMEYQAKELFAKHGVATTLGKVVTTAEDAKARDTFVRVCVKCHTAERVTAEGRSRSQWENTIVSMQTSRGAVVGASVVWAATAVLLAGCGQVDGIPVPAPTTVVGVMPPQFDFPPTTELWIPLAPTQQELEGRGEPRGVDP